MKRLTCFFIFLSLFVSCLSEVKLDLPFEERFVVEGLVQINQDSINQAQEHTIRITKTKGYLNNADTFQIISDATVQVSDGQGNLYPFYFNRESGIYTSTFLAQQDVTYKLKITTPNGESFEASDKIEQQKILIDSIAIIARKPAPNVENQDDTLWPVIRFSDPPEKSNFYDFRYYVNDRRIPNAYRQLFLTPVLNDTRFNGNRVVQVIRFRFPLNYAGPKYLMSGDVVKIGVVSISKANYEFQNAVNQISGGTGGGGFVGSPTPAIIGNIKNINNADKPGLGFFGVVSYTSRSIIVE